MGGIQNQSFHLNHYIDSDICYQDGALRLNPCQVSRNRSCIEGYTPLFILLYGAMQLKLAPKTQNIS